jgi:hypothetical protein
LSQRPTPGNQLSVLFFVSLLTGDGCIPFLQKYLAIGNRGYTNVREAFPKGRPPTRTRVQPAPGRRKFRVAPDFQSVGDLQDWDAPLVTEYWEKVLDDSIFFPNACKGIDAAIEMFSRMGSRYLDANPGFVFGDNGITETNDIDTFI